MNTIQSILITGGTGSFGTAFIQFLLAQSNVRRICVYSRGEHAQAALRDVIGSDPRVRYMVGDVRDLQRLTRACRGVDAIVHAAALKRIETGAYNPDEVVKTNVLGSMNVIEAAIASDVKYVVNLSSDKAFEPKSPYGQSKALAESLMLAANITHGSKTKFACTRYGNVWGAQGSVVPKWKSLIEHGDPITLTDAECTRFYMTINQAVDLVWRALITMRGGELVVPDLPAYRMGDLVAAFTLSYADKYYVDVVEVGLPEFEKRHESMQDGMSSEHATRLTIDELREIITNG